MLGEMRNTQQNPRLDSESKKQILNTIHTHLGKYREIVHDTRKEDLERWTAYMAADTACTILDAERASVKDTLSFPGNNSDSEEYKRERPRRRRGRSSKSTRKRYSSAELSE